MTTVLQAVESPEPNPSADAITARITVERQALVCGGQRG